MTDHEREEALRLWRQACKTIAQAAHYGTAEDHHALICEEFLRLARQSAQGEPVAWRRLRILGGERQYEFAERGQTVVDDPFRPWESLYTLLPPAQPDVVRDALQDSYERELYVLRLKLGMARACLIDGRWESNDRREDARDCIRAIDAALSAPQPGGKG